MESPSVVPHLQFKEGESASGLNHATEMQGDPLGL